MGFESSWAKTSDVVRNHYGERKVEGKFGGEPKTEGVIRQVEWVFTYDNLPVSGTGDMEKLIPDNAFIKDCYIETLVAFAGGTSYDIDLVTTAGAAIGSGSDKLFDALVTAEVNAVGEWRDSRSHGGTNSGNALDTAITEPGQLQVVATGTFTAGKARLIIEYIPASA
jgi:hypothetical protein